MALTSKPRNRQPASNEHIAEVLLEVAERLSQQGANPFRVDAYRRAAGTVRVLERPVRELIATGGAEALIELPTIGRGLAATIAEIVRTGRTAMLTRLDGTDTPETLLRSVPGIGAVTARRIHDELHVDTLEALEIAAHDGRLERVEGIGSRRAASIRAAVHDMLSRPAQRAAAKNPPDEPSVAMLLDVDAEYRASAQTGRLERIAPRRFNPEGTAWLPVLHTDRNGWHFTALFSNTARAHEYGRTHDWVVLYFYDADHVEGQRTVVTEYRGPMTGRRVVRGREPECAEHYRAQASPTAV